MTTFHVESTGVDATRTVSGQIHKGTDHPGFASSFAPTLEVLDPLLEVTPSRMSPEEIGKELPILGDLVILARDSAGNSSVVA